MERTTSNPFAKSGMPAELVASQQASDKKANSEARSNTAIEGGAAIIILGIIFVVTQIVGFGAGHKYCFAGKETYKKAAGSNSFWWWSDKDGAYADTWGYSTHDAYWEAMQPFKDIVNSRLKELQQRLNQNSPKNLNLTKTFDDYISLQIGISEISKNSHSHPNTSTPAPALTFVATHAPTVEVSIPRSPLEQAKMDIDAIADKAEQQTYFAKLPVDIREALKPWLKERKEKANAAVSQAELDDLF